MKNNEENNVIRPERNKNRILKTFLVIGICIALGILIYPFFMDALNDAHQVTTIGGYEESVVQMNTTNIVEAREAAVRYNEQVAEEQKQEVYAYQGEKYNDLKYDRILAPMENSPIMGHIEIPRLNIYLPITHGTKSEDLKYMIGHMKGTSVPIGGDTTHCVLAGHTGLQNADLFTYIDKLVKGDVFYIHVLNEIHVYTVDQIKVVLPGEEVPYLQIEEGKDYVTLFTCTPYGVNDHRLLVRGARTYPDLVYETPKSEIADVDFRNVLSWYSMLCMGSIPFVLAVIGIWWVNRKPFTV